LPNNFCRKPGSLFDAPPTANQDASVIRSAAAAATGIPIRRRDLPVGAEAGGERPTSDTGGMASVAARCGCPLRTLALRTRSGDVAEQIALELGKLKVVSK